MFHRHLFLPLLILFICMEKGKPKPLTHYPTHWATDPDRAQIFYLILQPARGHLPIVSVLAKRNGLVQSPGGKGNEYCVQKEIYTEWRYEFRGWIYKREKSNEFTGNPCESRGRACAIQSHDSQSACWMVPCAPPKATAKLTLDQVYPSPEDKVRLKGGRTGISATSGREKHLLQLRFLRNPTSWEWESTHTVKQGDSWLFHQRSHPRRRRQTSLGSLSLQARSEKAVSCKGPRKKRVWLPKGCRHRQGSKSNIHMQVWEARMIKQGGRKYPDGIFRWSVSSHRDPFVNNQEIITWPSPQTGNKSGWI